MPKPLFNLPDKNYQFWNSFECDGQTFNFDHLKACKHEFSHPKRDEQYTLYFTFSHHVFTTAASNSKSCPDRLYPFPDSDLRFFDEERYELSKHLPKIVATLPDQFCYHGGYSRYCSCKISNSDNEEIQYQVVYRVWKKRGKMRFHIESAYPLDKKLGRVKKVSFWVICHNLARGKPLPKPAH